MVMLQEGGLSRTYQMMNNPDSVFGIISASRQDLPKEENEKRTQALIKDIYDLGYGFTHMAGGYWEQGQLEPGYEHSILVTGIKKDELLKLAKEYDQDVVLYKDKDGLKYYDSKGNVWKEFKTDALIVGDNFDLEKVKPYFSQRLKGGNKRNAFTFVDADTDYKRHKYVKESLELFVYEPMTLMGKHCAYLNGVTSSSFTDDNTNNTIDKSIVFESQQVTPRMINTINEKSFSRLYNSMKNKTVGILTAYRKERSNNKNKEIQNELKADLRKLGLGFNEIDGYYPEIDNEGNEITHERSLIVYSDQSKEWMVKHMVKLGIKYDQDTVIVVDKDNGAYLIGATGADPKHPSYQEQYLGQFTASKIEDVYSRMGKDTFVFTDIMPRTMTEAIAYKRRTIKFDESDSLEEFENKLIKQYKQIIGENKMAKTITAKEVSEFFESETKKLMEEKDYIDVVVPYEMAVYITNGDRSPIDYDKEFYEPLFDKADKYAEMGDIEILEDTEDYDAKTDDFGYQNHVVTIRIHKRDKNESYSKKINEEVDADDDKAMALYDYLVNSEGEDEDIDVTQASYNRDEYETTVGDYLVFDSYEAAFDAAVESERNLLDDVGVEALNWNYMPYPIEHYVDEDWFREAWEEMNRNYIEDIIYEGNNRFHDELVEYGIDPEEYGYNEETGEFEDEEGAKEAFADSMMADIEGDLIGEYKFQLGGENFEYALKEAGIDLDEIAKDVVDTDGPANSLAFYDGNEIEWEYEGNTYYIYRTN